MKYQLDLSAYYVLIHLQEFSIILTHIFGHFLNFYTPRHMSQSDSQETEYEQLWLQKFYKQKEHTTLERIPDTFLEDRFNLFNLKELVDDYKDCYAAILDQGPSMNFVEECKLYYYLHQRFITFNKEGMVSVFDKIKNKVYGACGRYGCKEEPLIPVGLYNDYGKSKTKCFCQACQTLYEPSKPLKKTDGCAWGTSFAGYLLMSNPYAFDHENVKEFTPKLFGFDVEWRCEERESTEEEEMSFSGET